MERSLPEAYVSDYPVEGRPTYGFLEQRPKKDESRTFLERMKVPELTEWSALPLRQVLKAKVPEVWPHEGVCACGRRTFLFARCPRCIREEAAERHQELLDRENDDEPKDGVYETFRRMGATRSSRHSRTQHRTVSE